jgi:hypothetical protein
MGVQQFEVEAKGVNAPPAPTLNVLIWPLLEANRNAPSGVIAREMPWHPSRVSPLAKGDPGAKVKTPVAGLIWKTLMVWFPVLATNIKFVALLIVIRFSP